MLNSKFHIPNGLEKIIATLMYSLQIPCNEKSIKTGWILTTEVNSYKKELKLIQIFCWLLFFSHLTQLRMESAHQWHTCCTCCAAFVRIFIWFLWLACAALHLSANETLISGAACRVYVGAANCLIRKLPSNQQRSHARPATGDDAWKAENNSPTETINIYRSAAARVSVPSAISSSFNVTRRRVSDTNRYWHTLNDVCTPQICIQTI